MADLTITAANVSGLSDTTASKVTAGEAITAGQCVYKKASDSKYYKADANDSAMATATGIAISAAPAADDTFYMATAGTIDIGATVAVGTIYIVSSTAGGVAPVSDLGSGEYTTILGYGTAANVFKINLVSTVSLIP